MQSKDIIYTVFQFMEPSEILRTCSTSASFKDVCDSEHLWKKLYTDKFANNNSTTISPSEFKRGLTYKKAFEIDTHRLKIRREIFYRFPLLLGMTAQFAELMYYMYDLDSSEMFDFIENLLIEQGSGGLGSTPEFLSLWQVSHDVDLFSKFKKYNPTIYKALMAKKKEFVDAANYFLNTEDSDMLLPDLLNEKYPLYLPKTIKVYIRTQDDPVLINKYNIDRYMIILYIIGEDIDDIWEWENHLKIGSSLVHKILDHIKRIIDK